MGRDSQQTVLASMLSQMPEEGDGCTGVEAGGYDMVNAFLEDAPTNKFGPMATVLATIVERLGHGEEQLNRRYYSRGCELDSWSGSTYLVFFIDPNPFSSPDDHATFFVYRSGWSE